MKPEPRDHAATRAELEKRLRAAEAQVSALNQELNSLAYAISHDLRAPLRAIEGFSRVLLDDAKAELDPESQRYLTLIIASVERTTRLMAALLAYSRLSQAHLAKTTLDMTALARSLAHELAGSRTDRPVEILIHRLLPGWGDPSLIRTALEQLLKNAFKFTGPRPVARVEVGSYAEGAEHVYYVRDNGVGFHPQHAEKLFRLFQHLHRREEFEGAGAGLAIARRIVQRHGGRTWAEGAVEAGATFYFSLPCPEAEDRPETA
jgi:light-regulated signal transduction histidine kinase (bacteriophytochrome)